MTWASCFPMMVRVPLSDHVEQDAGPERRRLILCARNVTMAASEGSSALRSSFRRTCSEAAERYTASNPELCESTTPRSRLLNWPAQSLTIS